MDMAGRRGTRNPLPLRFPRRGGPGWPATTTMMTPARTAVGGRGAGTLAAAQAQHANTPCDGAKGGIARAHRSTTPRTSGRATPLKPTTSAPSRPPGSGYAPSRLRRPSSEPMSQIPRSPEAAAGRPCGPVRPWWRARNRDPTPPPRPPRGTQDGCGQPRAAGAVGGPRGRGGLSFGAALSKLCGPRAGSLRPQQSELRVAAASPPSLV